MDQEFNKPLPFVPMYRIGEKSWEWPYFCKSKAMEPYFWDRFLYEKYN